MDNTQPASFYAPGAQGWDDPHLLVLRSRTIFTKLTEEDGDEINADE